MPLLAGRLKNRIILGLMTFGPDKAAGARITSLDDYNTALDHLQAAGYNEIDTARVYIDGKQEAWTREAKWKERGLTLATKCYPIPPGTHKPAVLTEQFETSLKELGTDCVDIFYLHAAVRFKLCRDNVWEAHGLCRIVPFLLRRRLRLLMSFTSSEFIVEISRLA